MAYNRKDKYFKKAKETGFRARSAFKLLEINKKFRVFKPGMMVVDLGCAPGSWMEVASQTIGPSGSVIGIDLEAIRPFSAKNISFIQGDIRQEIIRQRLLTQMGRKVDLVLSDMSPHTTGVKFQDQFHSYELANQALQVTRLILREGGHFVTKIFPGEELETFKKDLQAHFDQVKTFIPDATRKTSTEIYLIGLNFQNGTLS